MWRSDPGYLSTGISDIPTRKRRIVWSDGACAAGMCSLVGSRWGKFRERASTQHMVGDLIVNHSLRNLCSSIHPAASLVYKMEFQVGGVCLGRIPPVLFCFGPFSGEKKEKKEKDLSSRKKRERLNERSAIPGRDERHEKRTADTQPQTCNLCCAGEGSSIDQSTHLPLHRGQQRLDCGGVPGPLIGRGRPRCKVPRDRGAAAPLMTK